MFSSTVYNCFYLLFICKVCRNGRNELKQLGGFTPFMDMRFIKPKKLITETIIPCPLNEVFDFFSKAENLNALTPPELEFKILTPSPIKMEPGTIINYRIKLSGIPFSWKTRIDAFENGKYFTDRQLNGPYTTWIHSHYFEEKNGKTYMKDEITYLSKGWILAPLLHWLFVDKRVQEIFDYRTAKLSQLFPV